jgi:hypothetical protein
MLKFSDRSLNLSIMRAILIWQRQKELQGLSEVTLTFKLHTLFLNLAIGVTVMQHAYYQKFRFHDMA